MAGVALLHLAAYYAVTRLNSKRPDSAFVDLTLPVDTMIPHLPWTWPFYWVTYPYVLAGAAAVLYAMTAAEYRIALRTFVAVIVVGAAVQLLIPARAPWPETPHPAQRWVHESRLVLPYANLPSMHVAFSTLTAAFATHVFASRLVKTGFVLVAASIAAASVTLKEHFVLDVVAGVALAGAAAFWWRHARQPPR